MKTRNCSNRAPISLKFKKWIFHKYQKYTRTLILGYMIGHPLKHIFDSIGFTYVLIFSEKMIVLKYQDSTTDKFFENARRYQSFLGGGPPTKFKKHRGLVGPIMEDLPNLYFMVFDRYEIHIQAFVDFINVKVWLSCAPCS